MNLTREQIKTRKRISAIQPEEGIAMSESEQLQQRLIIAEKILLDYCGPSDEPLLNAINRAFNGK